VACAQAGLARGLIPGSAWLNDAFTADRLSTAAAQSTPRRQNLLHLGTHFVLRPGHMGRSWLQLGDGQRMQLDDMARLSFTGQDLVTLSACETGMGGGAAEADGAEIDGLNALVLRRGAGAVVASLWRVEDDSTAVLMVAMYRALQRGASPAEALRGAQAVVRSTAAGRYGHPFYWAGFYLVSAEADRASASR
jgi:CHAT domain-containing protein